jgi:hypothetical protein
VCARVCVCACVHVMAHAHMVSQVVQLICRLCVFVRMFIMAHYSGRELVSTENTQTHTYTCHASRQAVAQRYLQGTVEIQGGRAVLIEYFRQKGFADQRACFELPYQYHLAGQMTELENALKVLISLLICMYACSGMSTSLKKTWRVLSRHA